MTGWPESAPEGAQPLSRRQLRERERLAARQRYSGKSDVAPSEGSAHGQSQAPVPDAEAHGEPEANSEEAHSESAAHGNHAADSGTGPDGESATEAAARSEHAEGDSEERSAPEREPERSRNPSYDGPSFRNRPVPPTSTAGRNPGSGGAYRLRDYSPPARPGIKALFSPSATPAEPVAGPGDVDATEPEVSYAEFTRSLSPNHGLTRRQLRALYESRHGSAAAPAPSETQAGSDAAEPGSSAASVGQPATDESPGAASAAPKPTEAEPAAPEPVEPEPAEPETVEAEPVDAEPVEEEPAAGAAPATRGVTDEPSARQTEPEQDAGSPDAESSAAISIADEAGGSPSTGTASPYRPPAGHWSVQDGHNDNILTSSIVMPTVPNHNDMQQALNSTGEIIITGSIDLPRSFGATGAHPERYDSSEIDRLLDAADGAGETQSDSAPVRASRAVSTHASTRSVVQPPQRRRVTLPVVLASTGGVLLVGIGTLLYFAFGIGI